MWVTPKYLFNQELSLFCLGTNFELSGCKVSKAETLEPPESPTQCLHPPPSHTQIDNSHAGQQTLLTDPEAGYLVES